MTPPRKTVWILGAGFSRSLGGPLLSDLLSPRSRKEATLRFGERKAREAVYDIFWRHHANPALHPDREARVYWSDAEAFMDFVDVAAQNDSSVNGRMLLEDIEHWFHDAFRAPDALTNFRRECVRAIATECLFAEAVDAESEMLEPYLNWAKHLPAQDEIITFNYDLVVEKLAALSQSSALRAESIVLPGDALVEGLHVLHLHGCVSWRDGETVTTESPEELLKGGQCPLLGTPGPTKKRYATDRFAPLWEAAHAALKTADRIVFLGYRFPPSDAQARRTILGAISDNVTKFLDIYTVVRGNAEDSARLGELLRVAAQGNHRRDAEVIVEGPKLFRLKQHALFVEDFLSLYPQVIGA